MHLAAGVEGEDLWLGWSKGGRNLCLLASGQRAAPSELNCHVREAAQRDSLVCAVRAAESGH